MARIASRLRAKGPRNPWLRRTWLGFIYCGFLCGRLIAAGPLEIDTERSLVRVRAYRAGLFSAFGHDHEIRAPIKTGTFDETTNIVELTVDARGLRVVDPEASEKDRAEIQSTMLGPKVLDSDRFPDIRFHATSLERNAGGNWTFHGELTLHGQSRPVLVRGEGENGHYRGTAELRQKDFGITPITVAGGAVKVKNEVRVEFEIVAKGAK